MDRELYAGAQAVVLGASGFIGRWVARALAQRGARVTLVVRDRARAAKVFATHGIVGDTVAADLTDGTALYDLLRSLRPSITFNLVGYGVDPAERDEAAAQRINAELAAAVCEGLVEFRDEAWPGQTLVHV